MADLSDRSHPAVDITSVNFEAELLQPSMTQPVLVIFWTPRSDASIALGTLLEKLVGEYGAASVGSHRCRQ